MDLLLSAKGGNVTSWRAVENFSASYRQSLLKLAASDRNGSAEALFSEACGSIDAIISTNQTLLQHLDSLIEHVSTAPSAERKELTASFYSGLYHYFDTYHSAPAFYQLSMAFLRQASAAIVAQATDQLGPAAGNLPEMTLIAVGPAGRAEYSPFCSLQILLVHGEVAASHHETIERFCHSLHAGFEAAGLSIDQVVTPRNARWRGTMAEWQQYFMDGGQPQTDEELIDLCRLVDQYPLYHGDRFAGDLKQMSSAALNGNRPALTNLIERMEHLSNGLGIMGRLKLERSGREQGLFRLLEHGLLPLSAALSALALIKESRETGNCDRIRDLLKRRQLDVELAERMLATWHTLHDLRLRLEQSFRIGHNSNQSLFLNPNDLSVPQRHALKETLESVAIIQRHVAIIFSGMGE
ncbi:MAG: putative nucleotidyltransferase substrate binding domain-containing protein [Pelobacteraceae bacterium]